MKTMLLALIIPVLFMTGCGTTKKEVPTTIHVIMPVIPYSD